MSLKTDSYLLGFDALASRNFVLDTDVAGALRMRRGVPGNILSTPITINSDDSVSFKPTYQPSFRNKVINGAMATLQYNKAVDTSLIVTDFPFDMWKVFTNAVANKSTTISGGPTPSQPEGLMYALQTTENVSKAMAAGDYLSVGQNIEGVKLRDFMLGTPSAVPMALSFWISTNTPGTYAASVRNGTSDRSFVSPFTITGTGWEKKSILIPAITDGSTWSTGGNTRGMQLWITYACGTNYQTPTPNAWATGNYLSTASASQAMTNNVVFYLTGVQLEKGTVVTPFEHRDNTIELAMQQRYWQHITKFFGVAGVGAVFSRAGAFLPVSMCTAPTISMSGTVNLYDGLQTTTMASITNLYNTGSHIEFDGTTAAAWANGAGPRAITNYVNGPITGIICDARI